MKKATIIIPTYNERENIEKTTDALQEVFKKIKNWDMSILVVDDTSPDKTYNLVKQLQKKNKNLHLVINKQKAGLGAAYLKGMAYAFGKLKTDVVFEFDADLSHDPTKIPLFLNKIDKGYEMVLGSRYIPGGGIPDDWGFHRKFLSVVGNKVIQIILTNFSIQDWTGGYRAITKKVYDTIAPEMTGERFSGYTFQVGFLHKAVNKKFKITEIAFKFKDRTIGQSKIGPEFIINNLIYLLRVRIKEIVASRVFKFVVVGSIGALTQLITLQLWRELFSYLVSYILSLICAITVNFILSNMWTFVDRKLKPAQIPIKFVIFFASSLGSVFIQLGLAALGEKYIGIKPLFIIPIINYIFDTGLLFAMIGILIGMFWNFFAYSKIVWRVKKTAK